jgi:hypothetical protein
MPKVLKSETIWYEEEIPTTLEAFKSWEFSSGSTTGSDFKVFSRLYKKWVTRNLPDGAKLDTFSSGHYDLYSFIEKDGKYVYFSISDVRYFPGGWYENILIRTAKSNKDYTGGSNDYTTMSRFRDNVARLFTYKGATNGDQPKRQPDREKLPTNRTLPLGL